MKGIIRRTKNTVSRKTFVKIGGKTWEINLEPYPEALKPRL